MSYIQGEDRGQAKSQLEPSRSGLTQDSIVHVIGRATNPAEAILEKLPRRGIPMILREIRTRNGVAFKPYSYSGFEKLVQNLRNKISSVPSYFTLDATAA